MKNKDNNLMHQYGREFEIVEHQINALRRMNNDFKNSLHHYWAKEVVDQFSTANEKFE